MDRGAVVTTLKGYIRRLAAADIAMKNAALRKVLTDELGHLEHIDDRLAAEHDLERGIRFDVTLVLCVLELVLLDIGPKLLYDFTARQRTFANYCHERFTDRHRFHKR